MVLISPTLPTAGAPRSQPAAAVRVDSVQVRYEGREQLVALDDVTFAVEIGEFVSVVGPSGCGKSSLLRVIGGILPPTQGSVAVLGEPVAAAQHRKRLGMVFQEPALLPWRNVLDNLRLPLQVNRQQGRRPSRSVEDLIRLVGLAGFWNYRPHELSVGMQQRVALARALAFEPDVLLMDEPLAALDEITRRQMRYELLRIWDATADAGARNGAGQRKSVIFVTHSVSEAVTLSDRVVVLSRRPGRVKAIIAIDLPRPRTEADERTPAFLDYVDQIREALRAEVSP